MYYRNSIQNLENPPKKKTKTKYTSRFKLPTVVKKETAPSSFSESKKQRNKQQLSYEAVIIFRLKADKEVVRKKQQVSLCQKHR